MCERTSRKERILVGSTKGALVGFVLGLKAIVVLAILIWAIRPSTGKNGKLVMALCWQFSAVGIGVVVGGLMGARVDATPEKAPGSDVPAVGDVVVDRVRGDD